MRKGVKGRGRRGTVGSLLYIGHFTSILRDVLRESGRN